MRSKTSWPALPVFILALSAGCGPLGPKGPPAPEVSEVSAAPKTHTAGKPDKPDKPPAGLAKATFGAGCFWCVEAVFSRLKGVRSAVPGYSGGNVKNPTYDDVCTGRTGHAEVVQVTYDPKVISYDELLEVFWQTHDPTTLNQQGHDIGTQYRSVIFYHTPEQRRLAEDYRKKLDAAGAFSGPIVTEIVPFTAFYPAEDKHKDYYAQHAEEGYCQIVIRPKLDKLKKVFGGKLK